MGAWQISVCEFFCLQCIDFEYCTSAAVLAEEVFVSYNRSSLLGSYYGIHNKGIYHTSIHWTGLLYIDFICMAQMDHSMIRCYVRSAPSRSIHPCSH